MRAARAVTARAAPVRTRSPVFDTCLRAGASVQFVSSARKLPFVKDIPAQWAKIRQGLDIFRISSKCVCLSDGEVQENLTVPFLRN